MLVLYMYQAKVAETMANDAISSVTSADAKLRFKRFLSFKS